MTLFLEKLCEKVKTPTRATSKSAGIDLYMPETLIMEKNSQHRIPLRIKVVLPQEHFGWIVARSGNASKGITVEAGIIDEDYRGELCAIIRNTSCSTICLERGMKLVQMLVLRYTPSEINVVESIQEVVGDEKHNQRGSKGFGSSD